jgi:hypothetical protein
MFHGTRFRSLSGGRGNFGRKITKGAGTVFHGTTAALGSTRKTAFENFSLTRSTAPASCLIRISNGRADFLEDVLRQLLFEPPQLEPSPLPLSSRARADCSVATL